MAITAVAVGVLVYLGVVGWCTGQRRLFSEDTFTSQEAVQYGLLWGGIALAIVLLVGGLIAMVRAALRPSASRTGWHGPAAIALTGLAVLLLERYWSFHERGYQINLQAWAVVIGGWIVGIVVIGVLYSRRRT